MKTTRLKFIEFVDERCPNFLSMKSSSRQETVAWMEIHTNGMVNHFEVFQISTFRKLVFAFHIHIIHQDILIRANQWKDARTLYCILRLLLIVI